MKATIVILIVFGIGLVFFFSFAANLGDGLERTMEKGDAEESSGYGSPLDYGDGFAEALAAGIIGFFVVLLMVIGYGKLRERPDETSDS